MTGLDRTKAVLGAKPLGQQAVLPIVHSGLAGLCGVRLGEYFSDAATMARVAVEGARRFGFDGVQLSIGVTGEAGGLGARVEQPRDAGPVLREHLLADLGVLRGLRGRRASKGGQMPVFFEAVRRVVDSIGADTFVLGTLRGPLNITAQLRGIEDTLVDMIERPEATGEVLAFATDVALEVSQALLETGAHGVMFGEATCSPNFISPDMYRQLVWPWHVRLVAELRKMGWRCIGLHVCGNILPILPDLIATGADLLDVDYQVPAATAIEMAAGRISLRGNLDPSAVFRFGSAENVVAETRRLCRAVAGARWILSSGCDIPPGTPAENLEAFAATAHSAPQ